MRFATTLLLLLCTVAAVAQDKTASDNLPSASLQKGTWELGVWTGGGHALTGSTKHTGVWNAGFRFGRVLTAEHGPGWLRGNLEWAGDIIPAYVIFQNTTVYGAGINPALLKWNFTHGRKIAPYFELGAGLLLTRADVPPATSPLNFTPQAGLGLQIFTREKRAVTLGAKYVHISNAGLSTPNPGINTFQFSVGYRFH
jgi:lipid A 3-O-deacylase